jgi:hypothetical protein
MYGFSKIEGGGTSHHGSYIHPHFQKNKQEQSLTIQRRLGTGYSLRKTKNQRSRHHTTSSNCRTNLSPSHARVSGSSGFMTQGGGKKPEKTVIIQGQDRSPYFKDDASSCDIAAACFDTFPFEHDESSLSFYSSCNAPHHDFSEQQPNKTMMLGDDSSVEENVYVNKFLEPSPIEALMLSPLRQESRSPARQLACILGHHQLINSYR